MDIDEKNQYLVNTGCWWFDPWWESDHWFENIALSKADFLKGIELLKSLLTPDWVCSLGSDPLHHPFIQLVHFGQGLSQIGSLYNLSQRFQTLQNIEGFNPVIASYKLLNEARSADLEMFMAYVLEKECESVSFIRAKSKYGQTPDILAVNRGLEFVVECKTVNDSEAEIWVKNYGYYYSQLIIDAIPDGFDIIYRSAHSKVNPREYDFSSPHSYQLAAAIDTYPIVQRIQQFGGKPRYVDMGYLGQFWIFPSGSELRSSISVPTVSNDFTGRRLVENAIMKANKQVAHFGKPGIVAISYNAPPDTGALRTMLPKILASYKDQYRLLMGVLVLPAQNILTYIHPIWITNPSSDFDPADFGLPELLEKTLQPIGANNK